jgi:hypothetical protein
MSVPPEPEGSQHELELEQVVGRRPRSRPRAVRSALAVVATAAAAVTVVAAAHAAGPDRTGRAARPVPASASAPAVAAVLDAAALTDATRGWTGPWRDDPDLAAPAAAGLMDPPCLGEGDARETAASGGRVFAAGPSVAAMTAFGRFARPADAAAEWTALRARLDTCPGRPSVRTLATEAVAARVAARGTAPQDLWLVRDGDRLGLLLVTGARVPGSAADGRVLRALRAALLAPASFADPAVPGQDAAVLPAAGLEAVLDGWRAPWATLRTGGPVFACSPAGAAEQARTRHAAYAGGGATAAMTATVHADPAEAGQAVADALRQCPAATVLAGGHTGQSTWTVIALPSGDRQARWLVREGARVVELVVQWRTGSGPASGRYAAVASILADVTSATPSPVPAPPGPTG